MYIFTALFVIYHGILTVKVVEGFVSSTPDTALGNLCYDLHPTHTWLPYSGTCIFRLPEPVFRTCEQFLHDLISSSWTGGTPIIRSRMAIIYDERDWPYMPHATGLVALRNIGDYKNASNWFWCENEMCSNPVQITNSDDLKLDVVNASADNCGLYSPFTLKASPHPFSDLPSALTKYRYQQWYYAKKQNVMFKLKGAGKKVEKPILREYTDVSSTTCSLYCKTVPDCQAFNYSPTMKVCQLTITADQYIADDSAFNVYYMTYVTR